MLFSMVVTMANSGLPPGIGLFIRAEYLTPIAPHDFFAKAGRLLACKECGILVTSEANSLPALIGSRSPPPEQVQFPGFNSPTCAGRASGSMPKRIVAT
jgi:hypothetical protein